MKFTAGIGFKAAIVTFLSVAVTFFGTWTCAAQSDPCENINSYVQSRASNVVSTSTISLKAKSADLIFLGESHSETHPSPFTIFVSTLGSASSLKPKCLLLEADSPIDGSAEITSSNLPEFSDLNCSECQPWKVAYTAAKDLGWKVFAIDSKLDGYPGADASVQLRDNIMAQRISNLFSSGVCKQGVAIVGKHHLMTGNFDLKRIDNGTRLVRNSLPQQLKSQLTLATVDFIMSPRDFGFEKYYVRESESCNDKILAHVPVGFGWKNSPDLAVPIYLRAQTNGESYSYSNEFDFTILVH